MEASPLEITTKRAIETVCKHNLFTADSPVLIMVSGGCDSTALCYVIKQMLTTNNVHDIAAIHVNHMIRGAEADSDQQFVCDLCDKLEIPLFKAEVNVPKIAAETKKNVEAVGRSERYSLAQTALESLCEHANKPFSSGRILTAHTLNDRAENFYMRSIVGTGPGGFRSMNHKNGNIVRPLLDISRSQLEECVKNACATGIGYKNSTGQMWREDVTNEDITNFRSFVRHEIMPKAKLRNPNHLTTLKRTMDLIAEEDDMMQELAKDLLNKECMIFVQHKCAKLKPAFGEAKKPIAKRAIYELLRILLPDEARIEERSIDSIMKRFQNDKSVALSPDNIQGNFIVSSNKNGVIIQPATSYRQKTKRI